jgi:hypothetical protein
MLSQIIARKSRAPKFGKLPLFITKPTENLRRQYVCLWVCLFLSVDRQTLCTKEVLVIVIARAAIKITSFEESG